MDIRQLSTRVPLEVAVANPVGLAILYFVSISSEWTWHSWPGFRNPRPFSGMNSFAISTLDSVDLSKKNQEHSPPRTHCACKARTCLELPVHCICCVCCVCCISPKSKHHTPLACCPLSLDLFFTSSPTLHTLGVGTEFFFVKTKGCFLYE